MRRNSTPQNFPLRWKSDINREVITTNFDSFGWVKANEDEDWNIYWATVSTVKSIFNPDTRYRLKDSQLINHFPNHYELTRKDLMVKNLKRHRKEIVREKGEHAAGEVDFLPVTYMLPADYSLFIEEFRRCPNAWWIMKPANAAQGRGIFIINKLTQMKKWSTSKFKDMSYVVSRYIHNPFLIGGRKFDLRIYTLVTSYRPLKVYVHKEGFARFCNAKYVYNSNGIDNMYVHLTNVAIQKHNDDYNRAHGGKWSMANLRIYIEGTRGVDAANKLFSDIQLIILHSLKSVQNVMINDKHCFECYGYDVIIDDKLKPWLVEVNASPSLTSTTYSDRVMKQTIIGDVFRVVAQPHKPNGFPSHKSGANGCKDAVVGGFELLYDEQFEIDERKRLNETDTKPSGARWR
eukprot:g1469.t1